MLGIALVGLIANGVSLFNLRDAQRQTLNMRGAYLEVMGDFGGSAAVIVAALVISLTGWVQADAVASAVIGLLILPRTRRLLRDALDILLEATPRGSTSERSASTCSAPEGWSTSTTFMRGRSRPA